jgi:hypothetical protein
VRCWCIISVICNLFFLSSFSSPLQPNITGVGVFCLVSVVRVGGESRAAKGVYLRILAWGGGLYCSIARFC